MGTSRWDIKRLCEAVDALGEVDFAVIFGFGQSPDRQPRGLLVVGPVSGRQLHETLLARHAESLVESNRLVMTAAEFWRRCGSGDPYLYEILRSPERHVHPESASALVGAASLTISVPAQGSSTSGVALQAGITGLRQELVLASTTKRVPRGD